MIQFNQGTTKSWRGGDLGDFANLIGRLSNSLARSWKVFSGGVNWKP
jgi:hypothetical protein